ncbi:hypothetical protein IRJ41_009632 [Triplophysa rosa]|uniref:Uncharacterized protein n=1 Tax=Triplophysa rosa TaxID=992332 RepID=A0A9W7TFH5_TRIRA|nr:hypothetical protein IRJ41_009632 [Triplophysa rosa]
MRQTKVPRATLDSSRDDITRENTQRHTVIRIGKDMLSAQPRRMTCKQEASRVKPI